MPFNPVALKEARDASGFDSPPPPNDYDAAMYKADIFESKTGEDYLRLRYRVVGAGTYRDHEWSTIHTLEEYNRQGEPNLGLSVTAQVLEGLGIDLGGIDSKVDLRRRLDAVEGSVFRVEVKRNGQYVNTTPTASIETRVAQNTASAPPVQQGYGEPPAQMSMAPSGGNAIYQGDGPATTPAPPPQSDVPGEGFPPQRGSVDPGTGEEIPF
jgi:hypothetical protein